MLGRHTFFVTAIIAGFSPALPCVAADAALVCLNSGREYKVGEMACIAACHGQRRLARCDVISEKASWTYVSDVCPEALLPPAPEDATVRPVSVAMTPIPLPIEHLMSEMSPDSWMRLADRMKANAGRLSSD